MSKPRIDLANDSAPLSTHAGQDSDGPADPRSAQQRAYEQWLADRPSPIDLMSSHPGSDELAREAASTSDGTPLARADNRYGRRRGGELPMSATASSDVALATAIVMQENACGARAAAGLIRDRAKALEVHAADVASAIVQLDQGMRER